MKSTRTSDKWLAVAKRKEELKRLTDEQRENGNRELASLGERTLKTVTEWTEAVEILNDKMSELEKQQGRDYAGNGAA